MKILKKTKVNSSKTIYKVNDEKKKKMTTFDYINKEKYLKCDFDFPIFQSEMIKIEISKNNYIKKHIKYCVLTKREFSYYKSKESYFSQSNPLFKIYISQIKGCKRNPQINIKDFYLLDLIYYTEKTLNTKNNDNNLQQKVQLASNNEDILNKWICLINFICQEYNIL